MLINRCSELRSPLRGESAMLRATRRDWTEHCQATPNHILTLTYPARVRPQHVRLLFVLLTRICRRELRVANVKISKLSKTLKLIHVQ